MPYRLRPGISYTWVGPVPLFLDIDQNRYFKLSSRATAALTRLEKCRSANPNDVELLIDSGILQETQNESIIGPVPNLPSIKNSYFDGPRQSSVKYVVIAAIDQLWAMAVIRFAGLPTALAQLRKQIEKQSHHEDFLEIAQLVGSYRFIDLFLSAENRCLVRSFALARSLTRYSVSFKLAIGVRTGPFGAHCWVQIGHKSLTDHRDKAREYMPVLLL